MGQSTTPKALRLRCFALPSRAACCGRGLRTKPQKTMRPPTPPIPLEERPAAPTRPSGAAINPMATIKPTSTPTTPSRQSHGRWPSAGSQHAAARSLSEQDEVLRPIREQPELRPGALMGRWLPPCNGLLSIRQPILAQSFISYCYNFDPVKYRMFSWVPSANISGETLRRERGSADRHRPAIERILACGTPPTSEFSALQDTFAYDTTTTSPLRAYLASRGIDISNRADSVKGLCWGLANLFRHVGMAQIRGRLVRRLRERNILQQLQLPRRRADERHDRRTVRHHAVRLRDSARGRVLPRPAAITRRLDGTGTETGKGCA